jgi:formylglycine-generating enzyme required for sulfatase activity
LDQTEERANTHGAEMSALEKEFLAGSQEADIRQRHPNRLRWVGMSAVFCFALVVATLALTGRLNRFIYRPVEMDDYWVEIPAGEFLMGSLESNKVVGDNEFPQHTVFLDAYKIGRYEITNRQYAKCVRAGVCVTPRTSGGELDHPVTNISWHDAQAYCEWVGGRLPTEAEWEKAARGGREGQPYPWGNEEPVCTSGTENGAQFSGCVGETVDVGSFAPNGYGVFDMAGNVWEWVSSCYRDYPFDARDGREDPEAACYHVLRGGSWGYSSNYARVAFRNCCNPGVASNDVGFRCAALLDRTGP